MREMVYLTIFFLMVNRNYDIFDTLAVHLVFPPNKIKELNFTLSQSVFDPKQKNPMPNRHKVLTYIKHSQSDTKYTYKKIPRPNWSFWIEWDGMD
jgi:hypothetical protein